MTNNNQSQNVRAAMSIDLGSEFLKLALVKHGVPMEIVLNRESHRKTPFALTLRQGERFFGSEALKKGVSATRQTYTFFLDIIGKVYNDPSVEDYRQRFPHMQITQNEHRGGVNFMTDSGEIPAETLLAMVLAHARAEVEAYATQPVKDVVIAVPLFFGNSERKAVKTAAQIAGLNLLQLLSSGAAAGLNYGVFRYKDITEQPQTLLIYDVGSTSVQATVVQYLLATIEEDGKEPSTIPKMEIIGVGFDPNVGGHRLTLKLRDFLVEAFRQQHPKTESDISTSPQAMTKLLREADRVKQVLSANLETFAHVECLFQDLDFRAKVTRTDLEDMFKEFEQAFLTPIKFALEQAKVQVEILDRILLMGAGTRVPRLQEILSQYFGSKQLSHNLNTDEAIALGAIYQAARESKNFIVKRFDVVDYMLESVEGQQGVKPMDEKEIAQAKALLFEFETREKAKVARDAALNSLESAVFDYSAKMEEDEFTKFGTNEELEFINNSLARMKEWLDEVPDDIDAEKLKEKRRDLVKPIRKLKNRKRQKEERPEYIVKLNKVLDDAEKQLLTFRASENIFAETDLDAFNQLINNTKGWFQSIKKELEGLADNQDATFSPDDIKAKTTALNRELKLLSNKLKAAPTPKPPTKEGPAVEVAPNANNKDANEKGETAASEMDVENGGEKAPGPERMKREGHEHDDETLMLKNNGGMSDGVKVTKMEVDNQ